MHIDILRVNLRTEPVSVDDTAPLFSWEITSQREGDRQAAYRITVRQGETTVWDSGRVECSDTINREYAGQRQRFAQKQWRNLCAAGYFSSDRAIEAYAREIWSIEPTD